MGSCVVILHLVLEWNTDLWLSGTVFEGTLSLVLFSWNLFLLVASVLCKCNIFLLI